ncbi:nucleotide exchange factor GrpE [Candidatus Gottesmanbacteria bacterium]|nr:nucleotide exchange factor GrpE [Candidatus Gottesmanbacteria bacterium]
MKKQIDQEGQDWKAKYLRALADYQNLERRTHNEKEEVRTFAAEIILTRLLPILDTLKKAKDHLKDAGLDLTLKELEAVFEELGVEKIEVFGKPFNPHEMECVEVVEGGDNQVVEEVLSGYRLRGKVIRVAQVKVGKAKGG